MFEVGRLELKAVYQGDFVSVKAILIGGALQGGGHCTYHLPFHPLFAPPGGVKFQVQVIYMLHILHRPRYESIITLNNKQITM